MEQMNSFSEVEGVYYKLLRERICEARKKNPNDLFVVLGDLLDKSGAIDEDEQACNEFLNRTTVKSCGTFFTALNGKEVPIANPGYTFVQNHLNDPNVDWKALVHYNCSDLECLDLALESLGWTDGKYVTDTFLIPNKYKPDSNSKTQIKKLYEYAQQYPELKNAQKTVKWQEIVRALDSGVEFSTILEKFPLYGRTPVEIKIAAAKLGFTSDPYTWNYDIIRLAVTFNQPLTDDLCATLSRYMLSHRSEMQALYLLCLCDINMSKIMKLGVATKANLNKIADELGVKSYSSFMDVQGMVLSVKDKCSVCAVIMNNFEGAKIDWMYRLLEKYNVHQIIPCKLYEHEFNSVILVMHGKVLGVWPITDAYYCMKTIIGDTKCYLTYKAWKDSLIIGDKTSAMNYRLPLVTFGSPSEKLLKLYQECIADDGESVVSYHLHKVLDARIADVLMESSDAWKYFKLLCLQHDNKTWISMAKRQDLGFQGFNTFAPMSHVEDNIFKTMFRFCCDIKYTELLNNAPDDFPRYVEVSGKIYDTALVIANDLSLKEALKSVDIRQLLVSSEKVEVLHA